MVNKIEAIPLKDFYNTNSDNTYIDLEAYTDEATYCILDVHRETLRDEFYGAECVENIRENDAWSGDQEFIKKFMLDHISEIKTFNE